MAKVSLHFASLRFLDQWAVIEAPIRAGLLSSDPERQRKALEKGTAFFGIARNLPKRYDVEARPPRPRFRPVVEVLAESKLGPVDDPDDAVERLTESLSGRYGGHRVVSAASKVLWLIHRDRVVIYDSRARKALGFRACAYPAYRRAWEDRWAEKRAEIAEACHELPTVLRFAACHGRMSPAEVKRLAGSSWFQRRVLDVALWTEGA